MKLRSFGLSTLVLVGSLGAASVLAGGCSGSAESGGGDDDTSGAGGSTSSTTSSAGGGGNGQGGEGGEACVPETEKCDGLDNDCNGTVDDGCDCLPGATQECYSGRPASTKDVGSCKHGTQTCDTTGKWGGCAGEVVPAAETCDEADNDCNGTPDDAIADIGCGVGACAVLVPGCVNGAVPTCTPNLPGSEVCDGLDNDCDQLVDEQDPNVGLACDSGIPGVCAAGVNQCLMGVLTCVPNNMPLPSELCDDLDNDCNGMVDDAIAGTGGDCSTGYAGVCFAGKIQCQAGVVDCFPIVAASAESCDNLDNDCNGVTDEGNPGGGASCMTGQLGVCATGTVTCQTGLLNCVPNAIGSAETCNGLDDNCDGAADEGNPGGGGACGCGGTFACSAGAVVCQGGPTTYFFDDFAGGNSKGWTLGTNWAIGTAAVSSGHNYGNPDPATDYSPTADNNVAGVVLGGAASTGLHGYYYLESPAMDTSAAPAVWLTFYRWLTSDYSPYMVNKIEVYNGSTWVAIWTTGSYPGVKDTSWTKVQHDISAYKNAAMKVRFGFTVGSSGVYSDCGQWNIDDITVSTQGC
jgi:hypothetical protein